MQVQPLASTNHSPRLEPDNHKFYDYTAEMSIDNKDKPLLVLVDDEAAILKALERELHGLKVNIKTFDNPIAAADFLANNQPALVISDAKMPELDGIDLLAKVAEQHPLCERILLTGFTDMDSAIQAINKSKINFYLEKPWDSDRLLNIVTKGLENAELRIRNTELEALTQRQNEQLTEWNKKLEDKVIARTQSLKASQAHTLSTFANLIEQRLPNRSSSRLVADLSLQIAHKFQLNDTQLHALKYAALLRNIGKMSFEDSLLATPYYNLSIEQRSLYQQHSMMAAVMLSGLECVGTSAQILSEYTENIDGSGYPHQLKGDDISLCAKILALASDYYDGIDGLLLPKKQTQAQMLDWIDENSGQLYDEKVTDIAHAILSEALDSPHSNNGLEAVISCHALRNGMILSRDLISPAGVLLLSGGTPLNSALIDHLQKLERNGGESLQMYIKQK